jgi:hypothetical protein
MPEHRPSVWWRVTIVTGATVLIWWILGQVATAWFGEDYSRAGHVVRAVLATGLTVPMVVLARRWLDRRPWPRAAPPGGRWRGLLLGMGCYLVPAGAALAAAVALGRTEVRVQAGVGELLLALAGLLALVLLYEAYPEELVFRGYVYRNLATWLAPWLGLVAQAVLFAAFGAGLGRFGLFFAVALVIGYFRVVTGHIAACIGFHLAFQTSQQFLGPMWDQVSVTEPELVELVLLGVVPLGLAVPLLLLAHRSSVDWRTPVPDPVPGAAAPAQGHS